MLIPSIDLQNGGAVQLVGGRDLAIAAGDPTPWMARFARVGEVAVVDLDGAIRDSLDSDSPNRAVIERLITIGACRVSGGIRTAQAALDWLDRGAARVVIGTAATESLLRELPRDRVVVAVDALEGEVVDRGWRRGTGESIEARIRRLRPYADAFQVTFVEREGRLGGTRLDEVERLRALFPDVALTVAGGVATATEIAALDALGVDAQVGMALYRKQLDLVDAFLAPLEDREFWPTVVCDERGVALGLVSSTRETIREAIDRGIGVYQSRRRGRWVKGDTSGNTQELVRVDLDCDRDAIRVTVRQRGSGFCHRDQWSCWDESRGLRQLERTVAARRGSADTGSFTARLFSDPALLGEKLIEEASELSEASGRDEIVHEASDVAYFTTVRLVTAGLDWTAVERELDRRAKVTRRRDGTVAKPMKPNRAPASPGEPANVREGGDPCCE
ncbi:MAG: phosphoribosyl-ATP diphosphatase [Planctomycetota bacterium]